MLNVNPASKASPEEIASAKARMERVYEDFSTKRGGYRFCPATEGALKLDITLLRPGPFGQILAGGGDIDNRLKTLFDALQFPDENQVRTLDPPTADQNPFFHCLMEDDKLVSQVRVRTAQRLDVPSESKEVVLIIDVNCALNR